MKLPKLDLDLRERALAGLVTPDIEALVHRIPKPVGSFGYDPWGYNEDTFKITLGILRQIYDKYFRVTAFGLEHVPARGRVLIIPNHSGQLPIDGFLVGTALALNPNGPRLARAMIERFFPTVPFLGNFLNAIGGVIGDPVNCSKMLEMDEAVIVFPEGVRGSGKLFRDRYKLKRFGNGFMHLAINHDVPIVPCAVVGCEETMPALADIHPLAKLLGLPYFPLLPVYWPLPAKVNIYFGKPMKFGPGPVTEAEATVCVDEVKDEIRKLVDQGLMERKSIF